MKFNNFSSFERIISLGTIIIILLVITGCSDKDCYDSPYLTKMNFYNIDSILLNGLIIRTYKQNSGFDKPVDSFKVTMFTRVENEYYLMYQGDLEKEIKSGFDYDVVIPKKGHFQITQINIFKEKCGNSIFSSEYNYSIQGYYVNNNYCNCSILKIVGK
jgi:hypothetical protein